MGMPTGKGGKGGKGGQGGKGGKGKGGRQRRLDAPMISRCPWLKGPFAPEAERIDNQITCNHCASVGVQAHHSGSWECDLHWWTPRSRFNRGEIDCWGFSSAAGGNSRPLPALPPPAQ